MEAQIQNFNFNENNVRTITDEKGNIWFVANDVCHILGYANPRKAVLDNCLSEGVTTSYPLESSGGKQRTKIINEGNLYRLILKSKKPEAKPFEKWVCDKVLPELRKKGYYNMNEPDQDEIILKLAQRNVEINKRLGKVETDVRDIKAKVQTAPDYFSIVGYATLIGTNISLKKASELGRKATKICQDLGFDMGQIPDPRFGRIKTYPQEVLKTVFEEN